MALTQRLDLRQSQAPVMTPQLQQAIKLLQMTNFELQAFVEAELERNPLLERRDNDVETAARQSETETDRSSTDGEEPQQDLSQDMLQNTSAAEKLETLDTDLTNIYTGEAQADIQNRAPAPAAGDAGWSSMSSSGSAAGSHGEFDATANLSREKSLIEHVNEQVSLIIDQSQDRLIAQHLIGTLNEQGYMTGDIGGIAEQIGASVAQVEAVLTKLQMIEPVGLFARDLKECLSLQLREQDRFDPAMASLVQNLELLAKRDFNRLRKECGIGAEDLADMIAEIRDLDPRPGNAFGSFTAQTVIPDVLVRPAQDGTWLVELNTETLPRVLVNNQYYAMVSSASKSEADKLYVSECMANATWLVKSLDQRARTILAVAREIVRQQDAFLVHGVQALRPLNLRTVADAIEMHESTVSRVTTNKYITTPRGIFEMKYFFTAAISSAEGGDAHSAEAVRQRIKVLISEEEPTAVLSDDRIVELLHENGIEIARRTVAKYREALGIPSSVQRRREKKALA